MCCISCIIISNLSATTVKQNGEKDDMLQKQRDLDDLDVNICAYVTWGRRGSVCPQILWNSDECKQSNCE